VDLLLPALVALFAILFLVAEWRGSTAGKWLTKPLASAAFVAAALGQHATATPYGRLVLAGLVLSWLGDVLLIPKGTTTFRLGLASFLAAHLAFGAAFVARGISLPVTLAAALVAALMAWPVGRWLLPHVDGKMRAPVLAYMTAISLMVALAVGDAATGANLAGLVAALAFYASDLSVARDRFVAAGLVNRLWGIPLYYAAQLVFAYSVR
jgi:uncharacterized membrane protein YhhN